MDWFKTKEGAQISALVLLMFLLVVSYAGTKYVGYLKNVEIRTLEHKVKTFQIREKNFEQIIKDLEADLVAEKEKPPKVYIINNNLVDQLKHLEAREIVTALQTYVASDFLNLNFIAFELLDEGQSWVAFRFELTNTVGEPGWVIVEKIQGDWIARRNNWDGITFKELGDEPEPTYQSEVGFQFDYPHGWKVEAQGERLLIKKDKQEIEILFEGIRDESKWEEYLTRSTDSKIVVDDLHEMRSALADVGNRKVLVNRATEDGYSANKHAFLVVIRTLQSFAVGGVKE